MANGLKCTKNRGEEMKNIKCIFFDIGYTLINEDDVWKQRCMEQAEIEEAKMLGLSPEQIYEEIIQA
ncbi:hypothetical protein [Clostridium sp. JN-9]|uniref:hypothetical protein n=1 Tax=Clostridium sp. JN-9 TaxID=2507159 RepID=UPI0013E8BB7B|nr:hypothetical protein [Clostridium sp. JN-9]